MQNYKGKLYGKVAGVFYPLQETTEDVDKIRQFQIDDLKEELKDFFNFVVEYKDFAPVCADITVETYLEHKDEWKSKKPKR